MASDLSSNCTDSLSKFDEREEGEISLEDVSSSEEGQPANSLSRLGDLYRCDHCASTNQCTPWCPFHSNYYKSHNKRDIAYGKENRQLSRECANLGGKHASSTLQEKNDDLVPISSDSELEVIGHDNGMDACRNSKRPRKKKRKRKAYREPDRSNNTVLLNDDSTDDIIGPVEPKLVAKNEPSRLRKVEMRRSREMSPRRHKSPLSKVRKKRPSCSSSKVIQRRMRPRESRTDHPAIRDTEAKNYNYKLLKKVKRLDNSRTQKTTPQTDKQRGLSLKDKLHNMLNRNNDHSKDKENMDLKGKAETDDEDEANCLRLRELALQTKPVKVNGEVPKATSCNDEEEDDDDSEALKLRLIALKSAIKKKYQRKEKKPKNKLEKTRPDSPFDNLLARSDFNTLETEEKANTNHEKNCLEDMDLDTDIEREKEKGEDGDSPYSPSDNLNRRLSLERELLGIDPSDVCYLENKSSSAKESSIYYDDPNSSPYCPSEPISNSCDYSPSSPTSSYHLSNDLDSDREVLSPSGSPLDSNSFQVEQSKSQLPCLNKDETHTLPLSPPPAPPQICTITNLLCASFMDDLEKDLDGSPLVPIDEVNPSNQSKLDSMTCDNHLNIALPSASLNLITEPVITDPIVIQTNNSCRKSVKKYRASLLKTDKIRANLKPVPLTSIAQFVAPSNTIIPVISNTNNETAVNQSTQVARDEVTTETNRKRDIKANDDSEPSIKLAKKTEKQNPPSSVQGPTSNANPQRKVSADEDELKLREMLIASMGKRKTDLQPGHSKSIIPDAKTCEKKAPELPSTKVSTTAQVPNNRTVVTSTRTVVVNKEGNRQIAKPLTNAGLIPSKAPVSTVTKKRTDLVNPNRFVTKKPVRSTAFSSSAMSNVVNKVNKSVELGPTKKVNLQKSVSVTFNTQSAINPAMRKVNIKDNSSMLSPLNDLSEFVIKVSEDSDSDVSEKEASTVADRRIERPQLKIPKSEFEKRIDTFLKEVRMNSENNKAKKPAITPVKPKKVTETAMSTPAAVRHLSASKQEEYRRLKQQILEREKKLQKNSNTSTQSASKVNPTKPSAPILKLTPPTKTNTASKSDNHESDKTIPKTNQSQVIAGSKEAAQMSVRTGLKSVEALDEPTKATTLKEKETCSVEANEPGNGTKETTSSKTSAQDAKLINEISLHDTKVVNHSENDGILNNKIDTRKDSEVEKILVSSENSQPNENVQIVIEKDLKKSKEESSINVPEEKTINVESTTESKIVDIEIMNSLTVNVIEMISEESPTELECTNTKITEEKKDDDKRGGVLKVLSIPELNSRLEHNQCDISPPLRTEPEISDDKSENDSVIIVKDSENTESCKSPQNDNNSDAKNLKCKSETNIARNDRREIHRELQQMANLPSEDQQEQLLNIEKDLISTRYAFLDDLTKLEQVYKQWELEKEQQQNLSKEIKELRLKLKLAEEKFQKQKVRLGEMNASAAACHDKVNHGREEYNKLSRICNGLGHRLHGSNYKIPAAGAPLVSNKLKVVAAYSEKLYNLKGDKQFKEKTDKKQSNMINPYAKKQSENEIEAAKTLAAKNVGSSESNSDKDGRCATNERTKPSLESESQNCQDNDTLTTDLKNLLSGNDTDPLQKEQVKKPPKENPTTIDSPKPYESCLSHLKDTRSTAVDGILCPFELRGTCNDTECQFVHGCWVLSPK